MKNAKIEKASFERMGNDVFLHGSIVLDAAGKKVQDFVMDTKEASKFLYSYGATLAHEIIGEVIQISYFNGSKSNIASIQHALENGEVFECVNIDEAVKEESSSELKGLEDLD